MMNTGMEGLFGMIALVCAFYAFYAGYEMKVKKDISKSILLPKSVDTRKCSDKKAYIEETFPYVMITGVGALIYGIVEMVNAYMMPIQSVLNVVMALFLAVLIVVMVKVKKINDKYF